MIVRNSAIVWQSRQTERICERLRADGLASTFRAKTGLVIDPYFSGSKIRWILDRDPELQRRAAAGALAFGTIGSWLCSIDAGVRNVYENCRSLPS